MPFIDPEQIPPTGDPRIDDGNRAVADRINDLYWSWQGGAGTADLKTGWELMLRSLGRHFLEEERIARAAGFEDGGRHIGRHIFLLNDLTARVRRLKKDGDGAVELFRYAAGALHEHQLLDDQDYWGLFPLAGTGVPAPRLVWDEEFATGVPMIDHDHRRLFVWLNRLAPAEEEKKPTADPDLLDRIAGELTTLFSREENFMRRKRLSGLNTHRLLHAELLARLGRQIHRQRNGDAAGTDRFLTGYLHYWLIDHIVNIDKVMLRY